MSITTLPLDEPWTDETGETQSMVVNVFLVSHPEGLVLVDTGMDPEGGPLDSAVIGAGVDWADITDVILTHEHYDHVGGLGLVRDRAPQAKIWAMDAIEGAEMLTDGQVIRGLKVIATPGHTPGHLCLLQEESGTVIVGDIVGSDGTRLDRSLPEYTTDWDQAEQSLHKLAEVPFERLLFCHGTEVEDPKGQLRALIGV